MMSRHLENGHLKVLIRYYYPTDFLYHKFYAFLGLVLAKTVCCHSNSLNYSRINIRYTLFSYRV